MRLVRVAAALLLLLSAVALPCAVQAGVSLVSTPAAAALEAAFPSAAAASAAAALADGADAVLSGFNVVLGLAVTSCGALLQQAAAAYSGVNSLFEPNVNIAPANAVIRNEFMAGAIDFAVLSAAPTHAELRLMPSLKHYPVQSNAVVLAYNLPAAVTSGHELVLSGPLMCRIFRANITRWNDPLLQAANPGMPLHLAVLSDGSGLGVPIQVQHLTSSYATALVWTSYCSKIDATFAAQIGTTATPALPFANFSTPPLMYPGLDQANSALRDTPYTLGWLPYANAWSLGNAVASFLNSQGQVVRPNAISMSLNLFELATNGYPAGTNSFDLTNPSTPQAWPMLSVSYLWLETRSTRTTCKTKQLVVDFMLWFLESDVPQRIGTNLHSIVFPPVLIQQLQLVERLQTELTCDGTLLATSTHSKQTYLATNAFGAELLTMLSTFYADVDTTVEYTARTLPESLAIHRMLTAETPLALVNPSSLTATDAALLSQAGARLLPGFLTAIVPTFNLPAEVVALYESNAARDTPDPSLPALFPLRLDLESLAALFLGDIASWLDPLLLVLNPQLSAWFAASGAAANMTVLVGSSDSTDPAMGARLLWQTVVQSQTARLPRHAYTQQALQFPSSAGANLSPFVPVLSRQPRSGVVQMIDSEARLTFKMSTIPGSVSYRMLHHESEVTQEWQWVTQRNAHGQTEDVAPDILALAKCGAETLARPTDASQIAGAIDRLLDLGTQQRLVSATSPSPGCYPLATMLSFAVQSHFKTVAPDSCNTALHALEFMHYLQSEDVLHSPMEALGLVRLADWPLMWEATDVALASATCNGEALIFMQPRVFSLDDATRGASVGVVVIFFIVLLGSALMIAFNRSHRVLTRDAAPAFQLTLLSGMILFTSALLPWTAAPTASSCSSLVWLVCLGFTLMYAPQVASLWQAWRFAGMAKGECKKHWIVPATGLTLPALISCGVMLAVDLLLVGLMQGTAPLVPQQFARSNGNMQDVFTHCSLDDSKSASWAVVSMLLVCKAALIALGTILAMYGSMQRLAVDAHSSRRRSFVATLTAKRMRRSLYLLLGLCVIIFGALVATAAVQSTLILLVALFLILNVAGSWALIFFPRFKAMFSADGGLSAEEAELSSRSSKSNGKATTNGSVGVGSRLTSTGAGAALTLASGVAAMDAAKLKAYLQALQSQAQVATRELLSRTEGPAGSLSGSGDDGQGSGSSLLEEGSLLKDPTASPNGGGGGSGVNPRPLSRSNQVAPAPVAGKPPASPLGRSMFASSTVTSPTGASSSTGHTGLRSPTLLSPTAHSSLGNGSVSRVMQVDVKPSAATTAFGAAAGSAQPRSPSQPSRSIMSIPRSPSQVSATPSERHTGAGNGNGNGTGSVPSTYRREGFGSNSATNPSSSGASILGFGNNGINGNGNSTGPPQGLVAKESASSKAIRARTQLRLYSSPSTSAAQVQMHLGSNSPVGSRPTPPPGSLAAQHQHFLIHSPIMQQAAMMQMPLPDLPESDAAAEATTPRTSAIQIAVQSLYPNASPAAVAAAAANAAHRAANANKHASL